MPDPAAASRNPAVKRVLHPLCGPSFDLLAKKAACILAHFSLHYNPLSRLSIVNPLETFSLTRSNFPRYTRMQMPCKKIFRGEFFIMNNKKLTTYQMAVTALMAAVLCVLGPLTVPIGAIPISLANLVICLTAWLLGAKFAALSVAIYLVIGLVGIPVFSGYGAGLAKLAGPTGGYLVGYLLLAFIGGLFIEKSHGHPVISALGLVLGCVRVSLHCTGSCQDRGLLHHRCPAAQASGAGRCTASERGLNPLSSPIFSIEKARCGTFPHRAFSRLSVDL